MSQEHDPVLDWVQKLNAIARDLDEEADTLHPSAWLEVLKKGMDHWKQLASAGPTTTPAKPKITAQQWVHDGLTSCLPPGTPLMGQIIEAKWTGKGKAVATLDLFDGRQGKVEVSTWTKQFNGAWSIRWLELEGGAINWTGHAWERLAPRQMTFFDRMTQEDLEEAAG